MSLNGDAKIQIINVVIVDKTKRTKKPTYSLEDRRDHSQNQNMNTIEGKVYGWWHGGSKEIIYYQHRGDDQKAWKCPVETKG